MPALARLRMLAEAFELAGVPSVRLRGLRDREGEMGEGVGVGSTEADGAFWMKKMKLIPESKMPAPRIELRWTNEGAPFECNGSSYPCACIYSLVIALGEHDIRGERDDENGEPLPQRREKAIEVGRTFSTGSADNRVKDGWIDSPYRDGAHARWDSAQLGNLPIYIVAGGRACLMEPND